MTTYTVGFDVPFDVEADTKEDAKLLLSRTFKDHIDQMNLDANDFTITDVAE